MKRLFLSVAVLASVVVGVSATYAAEARPARVASHVASGHSFPFTCSTGSFFQTLNGQLSTSANLATWTHVGTVAPIIDALAYSPSSGYLYGIDKVAGSSYNSLVQINSHGTETVLGAVSGLPSSYHYNGGDIDPATNTYYVSPGGTKLFAIDLTTRTAAPVAVPARVAIGYDLIVQQGWIWSVTHGGVSGFSLSTGSTKLFTVPSGDLGGEPGSIWGDLAHDGLYFRYDNTGRLYHAVGLRTTALTFTTLGVTAIHGKVNDGATCNAATSPGPDTAPVLGISGSSTAGLGPDKLVRVDLTLTNTYSSPVTVWPRVIKISLSDSSTACPAATNFIVDQGVTVAFTVPANSTKTLAQLGIPFADWPLLSMIDTATNQDSCLGTTVTATYYVRYYG